MSEDFWSRRRRAVEAEAQAQEGTVQALDEAEERAKYDAMSDDEALAALDLPHPESLKAGDDFSVFMGRLVPERLRHRALRCLWRSNPVLANLDELLDYGQDFTDKAMVVEGMKTAYQVGRGMLSHVEAMARKAEAAEQAEAEALARAEGAAQDETEETVLSAQSAENPGDAPVSGSESPADSANQASQDSASAPASTPVADSATQPPAPSDTSLVLLDQRPQADHIETPQAVRPRRMTFRVPAAALGQETT